MKKIGLIVIIVVIIAGVVGACWFVSRNTASSSLEQDTVLNDINNSSFTNNSVQKSSKSTETELASFSTVLNGDSARINNITVTCSTINGTVIDDGETFSFNEIVGEPSAEKGYQEADVIVGTEVQKGYGGGNCQVSTTIYNAVLQINSVSIVERNPHKKAVTYIEEGKDAAVSYSGGLDLKFKNETGSDLKIYASAENGNVTVKIVALSIS